MRLVKRKFSCCDGLVKRKFSCCDGKDKFVWAGLHPEKVPETGRFGAS